MLNFSVHAGFEQCGNIMTCLSCSRYSFILKLLECISMFFQVASGWSSSSVTVFRFTVDGVDPTPRLFITLYYYEIASSVYVDVDLNKHTYRHTRYQVTLKFHTGHKVTTLKPSGHFKQVPCHLYEVPCLLRLPYVVRHQSVTIRPDLMGYFVAFSFPIQ